MICIHQLMNHSNIELMVLCRIQQLMEDYRQTYLKFFVDNYYRDVQNYDSSIGLSFNQNLLFLLPFFFLPPLSLSSLKHFSFSLHRTTVQKRRLTFGHLFLYSGIPMCQRIAHTHTIALRIKDMEKKRR